jgi:hypothetical protein
MGSLRFEGVRFFSYPRDHEPRHVHGFYGEVMVVVELLYDSVRVSERSKAIAPSNAGKADVRRILTVSAEHFTDLVALWEKRNG